VADVDVEEDSAVPDATVSYGELAWVTTIGGDFNEYAAGVGIDEQGTSWIAGSFTVDTEFGDESAGAVLSAEATEDVFLAGYDADGRLVDATAIAAAPGSSSYAFARGLAVHPSGSAVVVGGLIGSASCGKAAEFTASGSDGLISWVEPDGEVARARLLGGSDDACDFKQDCERVSSVAMDADGGVVIAAKLSGHVVVEPTASPVVEIHAKPTGEPVVVRLRADGTVAFARVMQEVSGDVAVAAVDDGGVLVTGAFHGTWSIPEVASISAGEHPDAFVLRLGPGGEPEWLTRGGGIGIGDERGIAIRALPDGSSIVAGIYGTEATFGQGSATETVLPASGGSDVFIARYDAQGALEWVRECGGSGQDGIRLFLAMLPDGSSAIAGYFTGGATFGRGEATESTLPAGSWTAVAARLDSAGRMLGAFALAEPGKGLHLQGLAMAPGGRLVIAAQYSGPVAIGATAAVMPSSPRSVLLAALDPPTE